MCAPADIPAQICASTSGAWSDASDVLSLPWCSGVYAHAASHGCWTSGTKCPHGLLSHGGHVSAWLNSNGGQWLRRRRSFHRRQQRFHPSEFRPSSMFFFAKLTTPITPRLYFQWYLCHFLSFLFLAPSAWAPPQRGSTGCHAGCQRCNAAAQE